jgi:hypothetical protein
MVMALLMMMMIMMIIKHSYCYRLFAIFCFSHHANDDGDDNDVLLLLHFIFLKVMRSSYGTLDWISWIYIPAVMTSLIMSYPSKNI